MTWKAWSSLVLLGLVVTGCKAKVADGADAALAMPAVVDAGPVAVNPAQCLACQHAAGQGAWSFQGHYRDPRCTEAIAQSTTPACGALPSMGDTTVSFTEAAAGRRAGELAMVTLSAQVAEAGGRYRKVGSTCVPVDEGAVNLAPGGCAGQKICRDATGALGCGPCRTLSDGCPDYEETRVYAVIEKGAAKGGGAAPPADNLARIAQCCTALTNSVNQLLPNSPERGIITTAATQCTTALKGGNGNAPEIAVLRSMLSSGKLPALCAGL